MIAKLRFIKKSYRLEHMRNLDCQRLKNMSALVVAVAYFAAAWLGKKVKLEALAKHVTKSLERLQNRASLFKGSPAFSKGGDIPDLTILHSFTKLWYNNMRRGLSPLEKSDRK